MIDARLVCENLNCQKFHSPAKSSFSPILSHCCFSVLCLQCFNHPTHTCQNPISIASDRNQTLPCSRCKSKQANFECANCNHEVFCYECCKVVHSASKFIFHSMNSLKNITTQRIQKVRPFQQSSQNQNFQSIKNICESKKLDQTFNQNKDKNLATIVQLQHKVDNFLFSINLKKSEQKIQEFTVREKWAKIQRNIDEVFKSLEEKVLQKYESVKLILKNQSEACLDDILKNFEQIKLTEIEFINLKSILQKNKKTSSLQSGILNFIELKSNVLEEKMKSLNQKPISKDFKHQVSRQILEHVKKIFEEIENFSIQPLIKHENDSKSHKIQDCLTNLKERQKKKVLGNLNKCKNYDIQTAKKALNVSVSNPDNFTHVKAKKRKISIELYDSQEITDLRKNKAKNSELQRIKSFDFLSFTDSKTSLEDQNQLKTQKKAVPKAQYDNSTKKYPSNQQLNLNFIRSKIQNLNLNTEEDSDNFIKTSSQLVVSTQVLSPSLGTARLKSSLYPMFSPKGNQTIKQKLGSSNKTFSGFMNSPTNKMTVSGFKSPNGKTRILNDFNESHLEDKKTLKKNIGANMISTNE